MINKIRRRLLLDKIKRLELHQEFISPFFCGETNYPIEKAKNEEELREAKKKLKAIS